MNAGAPKPKALGLGSLDMSLRELLVQMGEQHLDHVVLLIPNTPVQITVTVGDADKTREITKQVQRILT